MKTVRKKRGRKPAASKEVTEKPKRMGNDATVKVSVEFPDGKTKDYELTIRYVYKNISHHKLAKMGKAIEKGLKQYYGRGVVLK